MTRMIPLVLVLMLAACGGAPSNAVPAESAQTVAGSSTTRGKVDKPYTPPAPGVPEIKKGHAGGLTFPTAFQGHWGATPADCDISRPDAPGLMKVSGKTLDFHDAKATATTLAMRDPYHVAADLTFKGGARAWQRHETLVLEVGGTRLARIEGSGTYRYERCS